METFPKHHEIEARASQVRASINDVLQWLAEAAGPRPGRCKRGCSAATAANVLNIRSRLGRGADSELNGREALLFI